jgi:hypothetical protein
MITVNGILKFHMEFSLDIVEAHILLTFVVYEHKKCSITVYVEAKIKF